MVSCPMWWGLGGYPSFSRDSLWWGCRSRTVLTHIWGGIKAQKFLPTALKHAQQRPSDGAPRMGFEILSQDAESWLSDWATKFCPRAPG